jgi:hypothetical protein
MKPSEEYIEDPIHYTTAAGNNSSLIYMPQRKRCQHVSVEHITLSTGKRIGWDCKSCKKRHLYKNWY